MDVTVAVATFGASSWVELAEQRAIPSAAALGVPWVHVHGGSLHEARNEAVGLVETEWVCHLDADDELEAGFFDAVAGVDADVRVPAVRYVRPGRSAAPRVPRVAGHDHDCVADCLTAGNWLVVGSVVRADMVRSVGGWRDFEWSEDWDLWLRCYLAGATFAVASDAVYRAHVRRCSRNRAAHPAVRHAAHRAIAEANGLAV